MAKQVLDQKILDEIAVQVQTLVKDYEEDIQKGFMNFPKKFKIGFASTIKPTREAGKFDVSTTINFDVEPKEVKQTRIKDSMSVTIDTSNQIPLPTEQAASGA